MWYGWQGTETIDPAGDVAKLQGRWERVPVGENRTSWPQVFLVIDGDIITQTLVDAQPGSTKQELWVKRFVLNSSIDPKVIRFTHQLKEQGNIPLPPNHGEHNQWYSLDGDVLTLWTIWERFGERGKESYQRVK